MAYICYTEKRFNASSRLIIDHANKIIEAYQAEGYTLTLRQLYYQFVSRDLIPNSIKSYKRLGSIINDARLAGLIDWDAIEDRTRHLSSLAHWDTPQDIIDGAAKQFRRDKWEDQPYRVEVWVEKEALAGVVERAANALDLPFLSCRGYTSQSEMHGASQRLRNIVNGGQIPYILHFGDHDPSGIDMSRDIMDRLNIFGVADDIQFKRMALNLDQIKTYRPPPNPAKQTDSRFKEYKRNFGDQSWELDALDPKVINGLITDEVRKVLDRHAWDDQVRRELKMREQIAYAAENWQLIEKAMTKRRKRKGQ